MFASGKKSNTMVSESAVSFKQIINAGSYTLTPTDIRTYLNLNLKMKIKIKKKLNIFMSSKAFQKCQVTDTELSRWKNCMKKNINCWMTSFVIQHTNPSGVPVCFVIDQGKLRATLFCPEPLRTQWNWIDWSPNIGGRF